MKVVDHWITENSYLREDRNSIFLTKLLTTLKRSPKLGKELRQKSVISGLIKYPGTWPKNLELFSFFHQDIIDRIQKKECYFIFDASAEGWNPIEENWFYILHTQCEKYKIDPEQIIFTSSNLKDEENIKDYFKQTNRKTINVVSFPLFEKNCQHEKPEATSSLLESAIAKTKEQYKDKYFSSLSRVNRYHRTIATFILCNSEIADRAIISHDKIDSLWFFDLHLLRMGYSVNKMMRWYKKLPLIVDYTDFKHNWAIDRTYEHIHHQTIFQIVNETLVDNFKNTSMFYSEKTFRPINCFQPFIIFGQKGCNYYLRELGYKIYDDWFDLSFDHEDNFIKRYQKLLLSVTELCKKLDSMSRDQQIEWKFKNQEILIHNANVMNRSKFTENKIYNLIIQLENQILEQSK